MLREGGVAVRVTKKTSEGMKVQSSSTDGERDLSQILAKDLPKAAAHFMEAYAGINGHDDLLCNPSLAPAKGLGQTLAHLRDLSWWCEMSKPQAERLGAIFSKGLLPKIQALVVMVGSLDFAAKVQGDVTPLSFLTAVLLGMEVSTLYCLLVTIFGAPAFIVVEEIGLGVVHLLKQQLRQLVVPLLNPPDSRERTKKGTAAVPAQDTETPSASVTQLSTEETAELFASVAGLMNGMHEFLCRHRLADNMIHQLIHMTMGIFFFAVPNFQLCNAAEELLVTIFGRYETLRISLLQEFLVKVPKLPSGRRALRFQLPVAEDNPDAGLATWTHLLLRLVQSTCMPLREPPGGDVEFTVVLNQRATAQAALAQLASGMLQRLLLARARDDELRAVLDEFMDELLIVAFKPPWPGALALLRTFAHQLIGVIQPDKKKTGSDTSIREFALKLLSKIVTRLCKHHVEVMKNHIKLPPWNEAPKNVGKDERLLQHIALRVSLEEGRDMPWTPAARAVKEWNAELYLSADDKDELGLARLTDEYVFRYLVMAHLEDERMVPARCPPSQTASTVSASIFSAAHPVHVWSFLVCEWAEASMRQQRARDGEPSEAAPQQADAGSQRGKARRNAGSKTFVEDPQTTVERFLAGAWTSRVPMYGESSSWRCGGGRRVLLPFTVYKIYRQLRSAELESLRKAAVDCLVMHANAPQASIRKSAMRALSDCIHADSSVLSAKSVEETIDMRLRDESSWVRQVSLDLLGRILEGSLKNSDAPGHEEPAAEAATPIMLNRAEGHGAAASAMLLRFQQTVRGRINDTSVLVRRQASKILSAFALNHPDHPNVVEVALDLLRRSTDSDTLRNLVLSTFEYLWFMDEEPTQRAVQQLARVVDASRTLGVGPADILTELLHRFKKNMSSKRCAKGFEYAIRRWTTLMLNEFVQTNGDAGYTGWDDTEGKIKTKSVESKGVDAQWLQRRSLLSTLEAFAVAQPKEMLVHLRPITVYLALEDEAPAEEQWVAHKVCQIVSAVLPGASEKRGLMDHRQVQQDLQMLIRNQPSTGVHEAVRCLCLVVKYVTGDLSQIVLHLNIAVPTLTHLCGLAESRPGSLERIQQMYISRQVWVLCSILESLCIDDYIAAGSTSEGKPQGGAPNARRILPRSALRFDFVRGSVASTVADLLVRLYDLQDVRLQAVVATCLSFFLRGHRHFMKDKRMAEILSAALASSDHGLSLKALETLSSLLEHFGREAAVEGNNIRNITNMEASKGATAVESAQPLAAFGNAALGHITLAGGAGVQKDLQGNEAGRDEEILRIRIESLCVVRHLHQQGLVNPMLVLPKVFALCFTGDPPLAEPSCAMLKEMLELRPTLLLNRIDEAFREAFLALLMGGRPPQLGRNLSAAQLTALGEVYADRFRRAKGPRDAFLRKTLREVFKLQAGRFQDRFPELMVPHPHEQHEVDASKPSKKSRRGAAVGACAEQHEGDVDTEPTTAFASLPRLQYYQLLYMQFVACAVSSLPFAYENEPLLIVHECNRHLTLQAGTLAAMFEESKKQSNQGRTGKRQREQPLGIAHDKELPDEAAAGGATDVFMQAASILTCLILKQSMRSEYGLTADQCAQFNPKEPRQERLKFGWLAAKAGPSSTTGEEGPIGVRARFPAAEWCRMAAPLATNMRNPAEIASYVQGLADNDPWDTSHKSHAAALDRLEGRRKGKVPIGDAGDEGLAEAVGLSTPAGRPKTRAQKRRRVAEPAEEAEELIEEEDSNDE